MNREKAQKIVMEAAGNLSSINGTLTRMGIGQHRPTRREIDEALALLSQPEQERPEDWFERLEEKALATPERPDGVPEFVYFPRYRDVTNLSLACDSLETLQAVSPPGRTFVVYRFDGIVKQDGGE